MRWLRIIVTSDVVVVTAALMLTTLATCTFWFVMTWLIYDDRYGINFIDYCRMTLG
jgi:hypothetical protein